MSFVRPFPNKHSITNKNKSTYKGATGFSRKLEALYGSKNYELRKAIFFINLANVDMSVCHNRGVIPKNFNHFSKMKIDLQKCQSFFKKLKYERFLIENDILSDVGLC